MANYSSLASSLEDIKTSLQADYTSINTILSSISGNYSGNSATKLNNDLAKSIQALNSQFTYIDSLVNVFKLIEDHKSSIKKLNEYKSQRDNFKSDEENKSNPYTSSVSSWESKVSEIERKIKSSMISISSITENVSLINATIDYSYKNLVAEIASSSGTIPGSLSVYLHNYDEMVANAAEWITDFQNPDYWTNGLKQRLSDVEGFPTASELDQMIEDVAGPNATPRTRAVAAAMTLISLEHDMHLTTRYVLSHKGLKKGVYGTSKPYDTETLVSEGADCASFMSWALNKANPDKPFNNATTTTVANAGVKTDYSSLQPGDILYLKSGGHVAMVICNEYDENGSIIVADTTNEGNPYLSSWTASGIRLKRYDEHALKASYTGRDLSEFYGEA